MSGNSYVWIAGSHGGFWRVAANWADLTSGASPSTTAPAIADSATIDGAAPVQFDVVGGPGVAATLVVLGDVALQGSFSAGALSIGQGLVGALDILSASTVSSSGAVSDAGNVEINGQGALWSIAGTLSQSDPTATNGAGGDLLAVNGALVQAGSWTAFGTVYVDPTAGATVGNGPAGPAGVLSVLAGATLTLGGNASIENDVLDNGTIATTGSGNATVTGNLSGAGQLVVSGTIGLTVAGTLSGLGQITLSDGTGVGAGNGLTVAGALANTGPIMVGAYDDLSVQGAVSGSGRISLGASALATFAAVSNSGEIDVGGGAQAEFGGDLTGSNALVISAGGQAKIDAKLAGLSGASLAQGATLLFSHTLTGPSQDVDVPIALAGADVIGLDPGVAVGGAVSGFDGTDTIIATGAALESGGTLVTDAVWSGADGVLRLSADGTEVSQIKLAGPYAGQSFIAVGVGGTLDGQTVVALAGGSHVLDNSGVVNGGTNVTFMVDTGTTTVANLSFSGNNALTGNAAATTATVSGTGTSTLNTLLIQTGGTLSTAAGATVQTALEVDGAGAVLSVAGTFTLGGAGALPELAVVNGGVARLDTFELDGNMASGTLDALIDVDPTGAIEVGSAGGTAAGALTVDATRRLTSRAGNAQIVAALVDNGVVEVSAPVSGGVFNASLTVTGNLSGSGSVLVDSAQAFTVNGNVSGVGFGDGASSGLTINGSVASAGALSIGGGASASVSKTTSNVRSISTGMMASLDLFGNVSGIGAITLGGTSNATFHAGLSASGPIEVGAQGSLAVLGAATSLPDITLDSGASLSLAGGGTAVGITLTGGNTLTLASNLPIGATITGFDTTDELVIQQQNAPQIGGVVVTGASYAATGPGTGTLTLISDGQVIDVLTLIGAYANSFIANAAGRGAGETDIALIGAHQSGLSGDTVTGGAGFTFNALGGSGQTAGTLTLLGNVAVQGSFSAAGLILGNDPEAFSNSVPAVDVEAGATLSTTGTTRLVTNVEVVGAGALLDAGALTQVGGNGVSELLVAGGGTIQADSYTLVASDNPFGLGLADIVVDPAGLLRIGSGGAAAAGSVNIAAGATLTASAPDATIIGAVVDNGLINVAGAGGGQMVLNIGDPLSGGGAAVIADGQALDLHSGAAGLSAFTLGAQSDLQVQGQLLNIGTIVTGQSAVVSISGNATAAGDATGIGGISLGAQGSMKISGKLSGSGPLVIGAGASVEIDGEVSGLSFIALGAGASLTLLGGDAVVPIQLGAGTTLTIAPDKPITGAITGFAQGDAIKVIQYFDTKTIVTGAVDNPASASLALMDDSTLLNTLPLVGSYAGQQFVSNTAGQGGTSGVVLASLPCFAAGTRIGTVLGDSAVEDLRVGDLVRTIAGRHRPITWIGHRRVDCRNHPDCAGVWPVRVRAHAFGAGLPMRDLYLSPEHAVFTDDVLIPIRFLVTGDTVAQVQVDAITYFHIELEQHDLLLADGLPCETFLDVGNRAALATEQTVVQLHPCFQANAVGAARLREALSYAPLAVTGPVVKAVRARIRTELESQTRKAA